MAKSLQHEAPAQQPRGSATCSRHDPACELNWNIVGGSNSPGWSHPRAKPYPKVVEAIRSKVSIGDAKRDALIAVVRELVSEHGHISEATQSRFLNQGYTSVQLIEIWVGLALKAISNYMDHINPVTIDPQFSSEASSSLRAFL